MGWTLDDFLHGKSWSADYGRKSLPVLVSIAEKYNGLPDDAIPDFTYGDLAKILGVHPHPVHFALGSIGFALQDLERLEHWGFGKIPPIQLMVWTTGQGSPGDDAFSFLGISRDEAQKMPVVARRSTARSVQTDIIRYPYWREVLKSLALRPLTIDLPSPVAINNSSQPDQGVAESEFHKRLKFYLGSHPKVLGLKGSFLPKFEVVLLSGDRADLMLDENSNPLRVCVEVKSRISGDEDIIRGIFQCIKYKAVLEAEEKYELKRKQNHQIRKIRVMLVTERPLIKELKELSSFLNIEVLTVKVPDRYQTP